MANKTYPLETVGVSSQVLGAGVADANPVPTLLGAAKFLKRDYLYSGVEDASGKIKGFTKEQATPTSPKVPVQRRVRLYRDQDGYLMREQWSDPATGAFYFPRLDIRFTYTALSYDHTLNFRAVVTDRVLPELMTLAELRA